MYGWVELRKFILLYHSGRVCSLLRNKYSIYLSYILFCFIYLKFSAGTFKHKRIMGLKKQQEKTDSAVHN